MSPRILVVEDEPAIRDAIGYALRREGFDVEEEGDGGVALDRARAEEFALVVLDVMLPGMTGTEICRTLRAESAVPILILTARDTEVDRVVGLELGADDYLTKPFSMAELLARVRAILRRRELDRARHAARRRVGGIEIDLVRHAVSVDGQRVELTPSEFRLLALLSSAPERAFSRDEIVRELWQSEYVGNERASDAHVVSLRRKLERDPAVPERIVTVRGHGYKLVPV